MKAEQEKWEGVPEWKKKLILEKERKKNDDSVSGLNAALGTFGLCAKCTEEHPASTDCAFVAFHFRGLFENVFRF